MPDTSSPSGGANQPSPARWTEALVHDAGMEGMRGAAVGAIKWGIVSAGLGALGWKFSPLYRGFTVQFKVFLQMSGMILGATVESDRRMREYEYKLRVQRRMQKQAALRAEWGDDDDDD